MMLLSSSVACFATTSLNTQIPLGNWRNSSAFSLHQPFRAAALNPLQSLKVPAGTFPLVITAKQSFQIAAATTPVVITVAQDGSGDFSTVQEAVDAVPLKNMQRILIRLAPGRYRQPVFVPESKDKITLSGSSPENTILTFDNTADKLDHFMKGKIYKKSEVKVGTFWSGTVIVDAEDFIAENVTFENSSTKEQCPAVAIRMSGDRGALYNCRILGLQDSLYLQNNKQYVKDCYIEGSVDFICGNCTALLEHCHIHCKSKGWVTAQSRESSEDSSGYVFLRCMITGDRKEEPYAYLGRPWRAYGRVVFAYTYMDDCIKSEGWQNWDDDSENWRTACFYEYRCFGPGSSPTGRVDWAKQLTEEEAAYFLDHSFVDPNPKKPWLL